MLISFLGSFEKYKCHDGQFISNNDKAAGFPAALLLRIRKNKYLHRLFPF